MYAAIIGDIINSKKIEDRSDVQIKLKDTLDYINGFYIDNLISSFTITLGDEFQGVVNISKNLLEIVDLIRFRMYPVELRFGIGIGDIKTEIFLDVSLGSDGPAYWAAREAIQYIHDHNDYGHSKMYLGTYENNNETAQTLNAINSILRLCDRLESKWTSSQFSFIRDVTIQHQYKIIDTVSQKKIAEERGLFPQAVNDKIKQTGIMTYIEARQNIGHLLQEKWGS